MRMLIGLALAATVLLAGTAQAQYGPRAKPRYGPGYRPGLSPYLNLLRGGDTSSNYYLGTISEQQRRANDRVAARGIEGLDLAGLDREERLRKLENRPPVSSGNITYFNNTLGFFPKTNPPAKTR